MCLKAALTAKRLICKKTLAGCDRAVCQPVKPEDRFLLIFFAVKNEQIAGFWQNTGFCSCSLSNLHEQKTEQLSRAKVVWKNNLPHCNIPAYISVFNTRAYARGILHMNRKRFISGLLAAAVLMGAAACDRNAVP